MGAGRPRILIRGVYSHTLMRDKDHPRKDILDQIKDRYEFSSSWTSLVPRIICWRKTTLWKLFVSGTYLLKRLMDLLISATAFLLSLPVILAAIVLIKLEDGGPALFVQQRVGRNGEFFNMYKFRSMRLDADSHKDELLSLNESKAGITFKMKNDPRITNVGRFIRKFSIDELPQLINVMKGEMSLVGPRPALESEVKDYDYADRKRLNAIPGITGLWQVSGRSNIDFHGQVRLDVNYIESQSLWSDFMILLRTIPAIISGKGAY